MASKKKQQNLFTSSQAKLQAYEQKQLEFQKRTAKRKRDNQLALIVAGSALLVAVAAQLIYSLAQPSASTATPSASSEPVASQGANNGLVPDKAIAENRVWSGSIQVNDSTLDVKLFGDKAPQAVASFIDLSKKNFFNGVSCHRLTTQGIYVLQCGDPTGTGTGGPGYSFGPIENAPLADATGVATYAKGVLAMANSGDPYSNGSQFFIVYQDSPLAPNYTVFGEITGGLEGLDRIIQTGVTGGATDGKPIIETKLGAITLK